MRMTTKSHKSFTDEERIAIPLGSVAMPTVKQVIEFHDIDKVTFYSWKKRFLGEEALNVINDIDRDELLDEISSLKEKIAEFVKKTRVSIQNVSATRSRQSWSMLRG